MNKILFERVVLLLGLQGRPVLSARSSTDLDTLSPTGGNASGAIHLSRMVPVSRSG